jgi:hypothetical protein
MVEPTSPTSAPGSLRSIRSVAITTAKTATPIPSVQPLVSPRCDATVLIR